MIELIDATKGYHSIEDCTAEGRFDECELCQAITKAQQPYTPENRPPYPWVKVEDKLPELCEDVLAVWKMNDAANKAIESSYYEYEKWFSLECDERANDGWHVTHWQYLPALPEKEQKPEDENKTTDFEWEWWYD